MFIFLSLLLLCFYSSLCNCSTSLRGHAEIPQALEVPAYYQCGGLIYTGNTVCVDGYYCAYNSPYYSQCIPITPTTIPTQKPNTFLATSVLPTTASSKAPMTLSSKLPSLPPTLTAVVIPSATPSAKPTTTTTKLPTSSAPVTVVCTNDPYRQCGGVGFVSLILLSA